VAILDHVLDEIGARAGGCVDFETLYEHYQKRLLGWAARRTSGTEDAEDLIQDTFLAIHLSMPQFRGESDLEAWVFGVARNVWRVGARARSRMKRSAPRVPFEEAGPKELALEATPEDSVGVGRALARVTEGGSAAIGETDWNRLVSYALELTDLDQLAEETGLSRVALKSRLSRSRRRLQEHFPEIASR
jgi:RNA polymerase sigma-70 factor, ECF subfamily